MVLCRWVLLSSLLCAGKRFVYILFPNWASVNTHVLSHAMLVKRTSLVQKYVSLRTTFASRRLNPAHRTAT